MPTPLIAGNWKMNLNLVSSRALVGELAAGVGGYSGVDVLICPSAHLLFPMARAVHGTGIAMGAQNAHQASHGAYTGEMSVSMLKETGCSAIIIGHSERRQIFGEKGEELSQKVRALIAEGLLAIYCVGETLQEREDGRTDEVVDGQLCEVVGQDLPADQLVIAYEPVWAIGTGRTATPEQAQEVHAAIRKRLSTIFGEAKAAEIRILYGGSVKPGNAPQLLAQPDIDGALVGGASLVAADFLGIISAASSLAPASS